MTLSKPEYPSRPTTGKTIGYIRVSSIDQNTARQLEGIPLDKVFTEKASGRDTNRPQLQEMLEYIREGDTLLVHSLDRLARSLVDLRHLVTGLTDRGVRVEFRREGMVFDGKETAMGTFLLNMMGGFAEFERARAHERQLEGIAIAKCCTTCGKLREDHEHSNHKFKNKYTGRMPAVRPGNGKLDIIERLRAQGATVTEMARQAKVSRQTVYTWLKSKQSGEYKPAKPVVGWQG